MRTRQSAGSESGRHNLAREDLAERSNVIVGAGSDFTDRANAAQQFIQIFEVRAQVAMKFSEQGSAEQFSGGVIVAFAQGARHFESGLAIAAAGSLSHGEQGIRDFGHGTNHHHGAVRQPALDDVSYALNRFRILYGSPTELHDDHGRVLKAVASGR
jgi:hypothetical protein